MLRYEEVGALLRDQRVRQGSYKWPAHNNATGSFADWWLRMLLNRVGDDHARLRRLANPRISVSGAELTTVSAISSRAAI